MAYSSPNTPVRSHRGAEYAVFLEITRALKSVRNEHNRNSTPRVEAIMRNRQLWTTIAASVADASNNLPSELRARLFYLFEFTNKNSNIAIGNCGILDALIDINTSVMMGLLEPTEE